MDFHSEFKKVSHSLLLKLESWFIEAFTMLPNLLLAVVIIIFSVIISKAIRRLTKRVLKRFTESTAIISLGSRILIDRVSIRIDVCSRSSKS